MQDPSTLIAPRLLDPQPGEQILDACAAPGGKTAYMAQLMGNKGRIVACDREKRRLDLLGQNLKRLGASCSAVVQQDWLSANMAKELTEAGQFDRILVDVPCTNTGVMRRRVDVRWRLQPGTLVSMRDQQLEIMRQVCGLLKPGGVLVYSTCSLEPEENEQAVQQLLLEFPNWKLLEQKFSRPFVDRIDGAFAARLTRPVAA